MSTAYGNRPIVSDGLVLCLDAANPRSYPGTGTTWFDLSGNGNHGTLVNGVGYSSDNKGTLVFDGGNDYVSFNTALLSGRSELTVSMYIYSSATYGSLFAEGGTSNDPRYWQFNILNHIWYTRDSSTGDQGARNNDLSTNFLNANSWNYITAVYSVAGSYKTYYVNGVQVATTSTSIDQLTITRQPFQSYIGRPTDPTTQDTYFTGNIANVQIHDRPLTPQEIQQNFNALRGRYGI